MAWGSREPNLEKARSLLRAKQSETVAPQRRVLETEPVTQCSLEKYEELTRFVPDEGSDRVRRGAFTYEEARESDRIARGEAIIRRVAPGPFEDPTYFAMLAYQAASLELALEGITKAELRNRLSTYLLGTVHAAEVNALAKRMDSDGCTIVVLNSGLVDFIYQAAKVVVEALHPRRKTEGPGLVITDADLDTIRVGLASDPRPVERLYATLEAYFFHGYPRAVSGETVPEVEHPPLSLVTDLAERWVIGHEYGHGMAPSMSSAPKGVNADRSEEYFADTEAMALSVLSACYLDAVPPEFPLGGAIFALACLEFLQRALNILATGADAPLAESETHPRPRDRMTTVVDGFRRFFDVDYKSDGLFELWLRPKLEVPEKHGFTRERSGQAYAFANILHTVWVPVRDKLLEDHSCGRPLHAMWQ
jgi:hypothetical protein